jgi:hypothetical protein
MGAIDLVLGTQGGHAAHSPTLLADAGMGRTVQKLLAFELEYFLFEDPDDVQLLQHPHQGDRVIGLPVSLGRLEASPDGV